MREGGSRVGVLRGGGEGRWRRDWGGGGHIRAIVDLVEEGFIFVDYFLEVFGEGMAGGGGLVGGRGGCGIVG